MSVFILIKDEGDWSRKPDTEIVGVFTTSHDARLKAWYEYVIDFCNDRNDPNFYIQCWTVNERDSVKSELLEEINCNISSMHKIGAETYPQLFLEYTEEVHRLEENARENVRAHERYIAQIDRRDIDRRLHIGGSSLGI